MNDATGETLIVFPCYNEAERLDFAAIEAYLRSNSFCSFLFVDDGSTDQTADLLAELRKRGGDRCESLSLPQNQGKAEAVRLGVLHGLQRDPAYIGYWDADLATPLNEIDRFRECLLADPDLVIVLGCRVQRLGAAISRTAWRHYLGRVFATLASLTLGVPAYDTQCGAKLLRVTPQTAGLFAEPFMSRWVFDVELLTRMDRCLHEGHGTSIEAAALELPLLSWRHVGTSKLRLRDMLGALMDLSRIARARRRFG